MANPATSRNTAVELVLVVVVVRKYERQLALVVYVFVCMFAHVCVEVHILFQVLSFAP